MSLIVVMVAGCDRIVTLEPDAGGAAVRAVWDPRVCAGDARASIEVRLEDGAGEPTVDAAPCGEGALEVAVAHAGWYRASAVALDRAGGGRALASEVIAIDGPSVQWRVPW